MGGFMYVNKIPSAPFHFGEYFIRIKDLKSSKKLIVSSTHLHVFLWEIITVKNIHLSLEIELSIITYHIPILLSSFTWTVSTIGYYSRSYEGRRHALISNSEWRALSVAGAPVSFCHVSFSGETKGTLTARPQRPPSGLDASRRLAGRRWRLTHDSLSSVGPNYRCFFKESHPMYVALLGILKI